MAGWVMDEFRPLLLFVLENWIQNHRFGWLSTRSTRTKPIIFFLPGFSQLKSSFGQATSPCLPGEYFRNSLECARPTVTHTLNASNFEQRSPLFARNCTKATRTCKFSRKHTWIYWPRSVDNSISDETKHCICTRRTENRCRSERDANGWACVCVWRIGGAKTFEFRNENERNGIIATTRHRTTYLTAQHSYVGQVARLCIIRMIIKWDRDCVCFRCAAAVAVARDAFVERVFPASKNKMATLKLLFCQKDKRKSESVSAEQFFGCMTTTTSRWKIAFFRFLFKKNKKKRDKCMSSE